MSQARAEQKKLATLLRAVGQRPATDAAAAHALAPSAHGEASAGPDVSLAVLVREGHALLALKDAGVKARVALYRLTPARLKLADGLAAAAKKAAAAAGAPRVAVTQEKVDWWDGATYAILQTVAAAFQGAHATRPGVPEVGFVSLRRQTPGRTAPAAQEPVGVKRTVALTLLPRQRR